MNLFEFRTVTAIHKPELGTHKFGVHQHIWCRHLV